MTHLIGGPYYELSWLLQTQFPPEITVRTVLTALQELQPTVTFVDSSQTIEDRSVEYVVGWPDDTDGELRTRTLDLDCYVTVAGSRKSRLFLYELSREFCVLDLWFLGLRSADFDSHDHCLLQRDKPFFRTLLHRVTDRLSHEVVVLGTIAYEADAELLFDSPDCFPSTWYKKAHLSLEKINRVLHVPENAFEYCWLNPAHFSLVGSPEILNRII